MWLKCGIARLLTCTYIGTGGTQPSSLHHVLVTRVTQKSFRHFRHTPFGNQSLGEPDSGHGGEFVWGRVEAKPSLTHSVFTVCHKWGLPIQGLGHPNSAWVHVPNMRCGDQTTA